MYYGWRNGSLSAAKCLFREGLTSETQPLLTLLPSCVNKASRSEEVWLLWKPSGVVVSAVLWCVKLFSPHWTCNLHVLQWVLCATNFASAISSSRLLSPPLPSPHACLLHFAATRRNWSAPLFATVGFYQTWTQFFDTAAVTTHSYGIHLGILPFEMMFWGAVGMWGNWRVCCSLEVSSLLSTSFLGSWNVDCWQLMCCSDCWHLRLHVPLNNSAVTPFQSPMPDLSLQSSVLTLGVGWGGCFCFPLISLQRQKSERSIYEYSVTNTHNHLICPHVQQVSIFLTKCSKFKNEDLSFL